MLALGEQFEDADARGGAKVLKKSAFIW